MANRNSTTNQHQRTRHDHATETAEDYVEAIAEIEHQNAKCRVTDLATHFAVSHVTVSKTLARLKKEGLVDTQPYGPVTLTNDGRQLAADSRARHEIVYAFLIWMGVSEATAITDAEGIEHHVSQETLHRMKTLSAQSTTHQLVTPSSTTRKPDPSTKRKPSPSTTRKSAPSTTRQLVTPKTLKRPNQ